jgi:hypothetical protein
VKDKSMRIHTVTLAASLVTVCALAGCTPSRPSTQAAAQLARDATPLMTSCGTKKSIDPSSWPPSFTSSGVKSVHIGLEGLYIETDRVYVQEAGVFIPCDASKFASDSVTGEDPVYLKVADGVFTYYLAG